MKLFRDLQRQTKLPDAEIDWFIKTAEQRTLAKGELFCRAGQKLHELGLLKRGILQVESMSSVGDHVLLDFIFPGGAALALDAALQQRPSDVAIEAVVPSIIWVWPYDLRLIAYQRHDEWRNFESALVETAFKRKHQRYLSLRVRTARERHGDLDNEFPAEWRRVPQHLLASYLNITPQYLSMLRKEAARP